MTIKIIDGCLLNAFGRGDIDVLAHCVNTKGVMGSGVAKLVKERYPVVFNRYKTVCDENFPEDLLGKVQLSHIGWESDNTRVANLFGQLNYGTDKRHGNYGAIASCLLKLSERVDTAYSIGIPYKMCSDRAGCQWDIILEMVEFYLKSHEVKIYKL